MRSCILNNQSQPYAKKFIENAKSYDRCDWCGRIGKKNRRGLCRSCNRVYKEVESLEKQIREQPASLPNYILDWDLKVAKQMKRDCIAWGNILKGILSGPIDSLDLEHWFRKMARSIARDDRMHVGLATTLGWVFTAAQRQFLAYLFWEVFGAEASHNRRYRAMGQAQRERLKAGRSG